MSNFSLPMQWNANPDMVMGDFTPIPDGWYTGFISEMEYKEKNGKPGEGFLQFSIEIDEGEHKGRQLFDNLNLWDTGEKVQQFVQRKLNTLCLATGQHQINDLNQLLNKRVMIRVKLQEGREVQDENTGLVKKYEPRNQISTYKALPSGGTPASTPPSVQSPSSAQPAQPAAQPAEAKQTPAPTAAPAAQPAAPAASAPAAAAPAGSGGSVPPWLQGK